MVNFPQRLLDGYASFRAGRYASEAERYRRLGEGQQKPSIMMIACCDSRAAPETIFDAGPGEIFVVRNVANLVPPYAPDGRHHSTSAALEFAVLQLGVQHIVIMGHGRCGGIRAITEPGAPLSTGDFIGKWLAGVRDVAETVEHDHSPDERLTLVEQASVEHSLANLRTFPWVRVRESKGQLTLNGAWFDISQGELNVFDEKERRWTVV
ncbi:carbonic anhydrase [Taklimakanibacter lacteus]|uniref:carbonic anhydrase n=1 Tax=Taklimakanibacter lacteus TaxID=2268456 RepID=UPI000E668A8F